MGNTICECSQSSSNVYTLLPALKVAKIKINTYKLYEFCSRFNNKNNISSLFTCKGINTVYEDITYCIESVNSILKNPIAYRRLKMIYIWSYRVVNKKEECGTHPILPPLYHPFSLKLNPVINPSIIRITPLLYKNSEHIWKIFIWLEPISSLCYTSAFLPF